MGLGIVGFEALRPAISVYFDGFFFFFLLALFFFTTFQSLTPHAWDFLGSTNCFIILFNWDKGAEDIAFMYVWEQFCLPGSEEETGIFFSMIPEYGVRGHFTICFLYPLERFGKILFSRQVSAETERHEPASVRLLTAWAYGV